MPRPLLAHAVSARLRQPVISIGNLAFGGRGKTPLVAAVARLLQAAGERPAILSRGYGRRRAEDGAVIVSDGTHVLADVDRAGDEPLLLARSVPGAVVVVCDQRAVAGALAERVCGATVHVLDDGFQHRALARDLDLVLVSPRDVADRSVPLGRLREPLSALARADAIVVDDDPAPRSDLDAEAPAVDAAGRGRGDRAPLPLPAGSPAAVFRLVRALGAPVPLEPDRAWPGVDPGVVAVAGIASPSRFVRALEGRGVRVAYALEYRDHHRYTARDLAHIARAAARAGVPAVVTTAKDAVRLLPLRPFPLPIAAAPLEASVDEGETFRSWLFARLAEARP
jgi:tetraacyldisaccharide 4'-kinase